MHKGGKGRLQRVVKRAEVQELVQQMHASVVGGCHFGINATHRQHQGRASQCTVLSQSASGFAAAPPNAVMVIHAPELWVTVADIDEAVCYIDSLRPHRPITA